MERVYAVPGTPIFLGYQGEEKAREVLFNIGQWMSDYGPGEVQLFARRPGESTMYPVPLRREGAYAVWSVAPEDVAVPGQTGQCELSYHPDPESIVKREVWTTQVLPALGDGDPAIPPIGQAWVDTLRKTIAENEAIAAGAEKSARESAQSASASATRASAAANSAKEAEAAKRAIAEMAVRAVQLSHDKEATVTAELVDGVYRLLFGIPEGKPGDKGDPFTYEDFTEEQLAQLKGDPGYTPQKNVDYFDGYTPQKNVDYFDGADGGYYVPYGENGEMKFTPSKEGMPEVGGVPLPQGKAGVSPRIDVSTVDGGHRVSVTDVDGTKFFDVMDGKDGQGGSGGVVQADWNENDPEADDYVKNRPFYSYTETTVNESLLASGTYTSEPMDDLGGAFAAVVPTDSSVVMTNPKFNIVFDGVSYHQKDIISTDAGPVVGNVAILGPIFEAYGLPVPDDTGEPFVMLIPDTETWDGVLLVTDLFQSTTHDLSISYVTETTEDVVVKLPRKYYDSAGASWVDSYGTDKGEIFNNYKENVASGGYSHAEGSATTASGGCSHAEGNKTTASGANSHAEGTGTIASGVKSHAEGSHTVAIGEDSHAEGQNTSAKGQGSHAEGRLTNADGSRSHAEGNDTTASGDYSHAEGSATTASGGCSHAEGNKTTASGANSHAEGFSTIARGRSQHVQGEYNIEDNTDKYAHIVGNGSGGAHSNAHTLDWDGLGWFAGGLKVGGTGQDDASAVAVLTAADVEGIVNEVLSRFTDVSKEGA